MALDIKPTRSELIKLKGRIKQTRNGYKLLKMKRDGLFHEFRQLLAAMIEAKRDLTATYRLAKHVSTLQTQSKAVLPSEQLRLLTPVIQKLRLNADTSWVLLCQA